ncbi:MAG: FAD-dependent oxidoreductase, partial [Armatimonadia bacterium]|nr:FAD-dependent oxidoreductase [Armatimonadia bacterium]
MPTPLHTTRTPLPPRRSILREATGMSANGRFVIIGGGPAGIAAAITAINAGFPAEQITLFEKGERHDSSRTSGFGGAGANSDGKLVLESEIGGELETWVGERMPSLLEDVLDLYLGFIAPEDRAQYEAMRGRFSDPEAGEAIQQACIHAGLQYIPADIIPLGTTTCRGVVDAWHDFLVEHGADVRLQTRVRGFQPADDGWTVTVEDGAEVRARWLLAAPGRSGHGFLVDVLTDNEIATVNGPIDVGVRVETDAQVTRRLTDATWEFKLRGILEGERVRTFCVCPEGSVLVERYDSDLPAVNGQTLPEKPTGLTNFAVLHTIHLDDPCDSPTEFAQAYIRTVNILGARNPIVQTWPKFAARRRSRESDLCKAFI